MDTLSVPLTVAALVKPEAGTVGGTARYRCMGGAPLSTMSAAPGDGRRVGAAEVGQHRARRYRHGRGRAARQDGRAAATSTRPPLAAGEHRLVPPLTIVPCAAPPLDQLHAAAGDRAAAVEAAADDDLAAGRFDRLAARHAGRTGRQPGGRRRSCRRSRCRTTTSPATAADRAGAVGAAAMDHRDAARLEQLCAGQAAGEHRLEAMADQRADGGATGISWVPPLPTTPRAATGEDLFVAAAGHDRAAVVAARRYEPAPPRRSCWHAPCPRTGSRCHRCRWCWRCRCRRSGSPRRRLRP